MALTDDQLLQLIGDYLQDNTSEDITPAEVREVFTQLVQAKASIQRLAEFAKLASPKFSGAPEVPTAAAGTNTNQVASTGFVQAALAAAIAGKGLTELVLPMAVQGGNWYLTMGGLWEARRSFTASADPVSGANWRQVASFTGPAVTITADSITDATPAGRRLLTAASAAQQRALLGNPSIVANQYGQGHPAFNVTDGEPGVLAWLIRGVLASLAAVAPAAPTDGQVDDVSKVFSFLANPLFPAAAQYKVSGLPGITGPVFLDAVNSYVQADRIYIKVGAGVPKGNLGVYVAGSGSRPDGAVLTNDEAFTGAAVTPPSAELKAALALSLAQITLGTNVGYSISPSGGTAPYSYEVVATNVATGATFALGTTKSGSWQPPTADQFSIDATVTDSSNPAKSVETVTRYLNVVPAVNRIPVADAGSDLTIQLPTNTAALLGHATDPDNDPITAHAWRQITGPNSATGLPATTQNVVVSNLVAGTYQVGYRASDSRGGQSAEAYLLLEVAPAASSSARKAFIYTNGDSIMDGDTLADRAHDRWIQQLIPNVDAAKFGGFASIAVSGQSTGDMLNRIGGLELPMLNGLDLTVYDQIICVFDGGENDMMFGSSAGQVRTNRTAYMAQVQAGITNGLPIKFIEVSMLPNGKVYGNTSLADYETTRQAFNHDTAANFQAYGAYEYVNFNAESRLNNVHDSNFFSADQQHPAYAGHTAMMQQILPYAVAAQAGQFVAPKADLGAIGSGTGTGSAPTANNLVVQPAVPVRRQNVTISGNAITSTVGAGGSTGFAAGAINQFALGWQANTVVLGAVAFVLNHADGEWVGGFNVTGHNAGADYPEIAFAFHLSEGTQKLGIRAFGSGAGVAPSSADGYIDFTDGDVALLVREQTRVVWYVAGRQIFTTPNTDTSDWIIDFALKGLSTKMRSISYTAARPVDLGGDESAAVYNRDFTTLPVGQIADGWTVNGGTSAQIQSDGLHLFARYETEYVGISRDYQYQDGEFTVKNAGTDIMMHWHQQGNKFIAFWAQNGGSSHNAGILNGSNVSVFGGVDSNLDASGVGGVHYMSMRTVGKILELRIWRDGESRPATAMYSVDISTRDGDLVGPGFASITTLPSECRLLEAHLTDVV